MMKLTRSDVEGFLADRPRTEATRRYYASIMRRFLGWIGNRDFNEAEVKKYLSTIKHPRSRNTVLMVLKSFADWKYKRIPISDPANALKERMKLELVRDIRPERVVRELTKRALTDQELEAILKKLKGAELATMWLMFYFGCRLGELLELAPNAVDFRRGEVSFTTEKTKVKRRVSFDDFTAIQLRTFLDKKSSLNPVRVWKLFRHYGIKPRTARDTFITRMQESLAKAGFEPIRLDILVKMIAGHTVPDITATYTAVQQYIRDAMLKYHYLRNLEEKLKLNLPRAG